MHIVKALEALRKLELKVQDLYAYYYTLLIWTVRLQVVSLN